MAKRPPYVYVLAGTVPKMLGSAENDFDKPRSEFELFYRNGYADIVGMPPIVDHVPAKLKKITIVILRILTALRVIIVSRRYQAVVTSGEDIGIFVALFSKILNLKTPIFVVTHGFLFSSRWFRLLLSRIKSLENLRFVCLSESLRQSMIKDHDIPAWQVENGGYGVDTDFFSPSKQDRRPDLVVSAGVSNRDYQTLVKAVEGLNLTVRIASGSTWSSKVIDEISGDDKIIWGACANYRELRDLYREAAVVVVPTFDAQHVSGLAVIGEAMACGCLVIATNSYVKSDFIVHGVNGYLYNPGNDKQLKEMILQVIGGRLHENGSITKNSLHSIISCSIEKYVERLIEIILYNLPRGGTHNFENLF